MSHERDGPQQHRSLGAAGPLRHQQLHLQLWLRRVWRTSSLHRLPWVRPVTVQVPPHGHEHHGAVH